MRAVLPTLLLILGITCVISAIMYVVNRFTKKNISNICYRLSVVVLIAYIAALLYVTILSRSPSDQKKFYLIPLGDIISIINQKRFRDLEYLALNIVMFIPFGFLGRYIIRTPHNIVIIGLGFSISVMIEIVQYITFRGAFDINDIIYNSIGTVIGLYIMEYCKKRRSKK